MSCRAYTGTKSKPIHVSPIVSSTENLSVSKSRIRISRLPKAVCLPV